MKRCIVLFIGTVLLLSDVKAQEKDSWNESRILIEQKIKLQHYQEAVELLDEAISKPISDVGLIEAYLLNIRIALKTGSYEVAEFYFGRVEPLISSTEDPQLKIACILTKLSLEFRTIDASNLLKHIDDLRKESEFKDNAAFQAGLRKMIVLCNLKLGRFDEALRQTNVNMAEFKALSNHEEYSNSLQNKAFCLIELNRQDSVLELVNQSIQIARNKGFMELQLEGYFLLGKYYLQFGPKEAALMHLDAARALTSQSGKPSLESRVFLAEYYYEFYMSDENYKEALNWHKKYAMARDSLYKEEASLKSAFSASIQTIAEQQNKISRNQYAVAILIICIGIVVVYVIMQRRMIKLKSNTEEKLREQYHSLKRQRQALLDQKDSIEKRNQRLESFLIMLETLGNSSQVNQGNIQKALEEICHIIQDGLKVSRVSIWDFREETTSISSRIMLVDGQVLTDVTTLHSTDYPSYFKAIQEKKLIIADDAQTDATTREFAHGYLDVYNIKSMLDAPILYNGKLVGIICCEHTGEMRDWETEETIFLLALSDFISITLLSEKIRSQNEILLESNLTLEDSVRMRTMELELQNKQLAEYAFVNSHLLRSPLAKILGLAEIMKYELKDENKQLVDAMIESAEELDVIVKQIGEGLYNGKHFSRSEINALKKNMLSNDTD